jgi:hypothetical protein
MNKIITFILASAFVCICQTEAEGDLSPSVRKKVITIAGRELQRRNIVLPAKYDVSALPMEMITEVRRPRPLYEVNFHFVWRGKRRLIYSVVIDKHSLKVVMFSDDRLTIPSGF